MKYIRSIEDLTAQKEEGFRWLARKNNNWLHTFKEFPTKKDGDWDTDGMVDHQAIESQVGEFYAIIESSDEEPVHLPTFLQLKQKERA